MEYTPVAKIIKLIEEATKEMTRTEVQKFIEGIDNYVIREAD